MLMAEAFSNDFHEIMEHSFNELPVIRGLPECPFAGNALRAIRGGGMVRVLAPQQVVNGPSAFCPESALEEVE